MRRTTFALCGIAAAILAACGPKKLDASKLPRSSAFTGESLNIAMISRDSSNAEQATARFGAEAAARDLARSSGVKVNVEWIAAESNDASAQLKAFKDAVSTKPDAILVDCVDGKTISPAIDRAVDDGIQVMTYEFDSPQSRRFSHYGFADFAAGARVMRDLARMGGTRGNIAVYAGDAHSLPSSERVAGVLSEARKMKAMKIVGVFHGPETTVGSCDVIKDVIAKHPEIDAWILVGPWPLNNQALLKYLDPENVKLIALGCTPSSLYFVDKGAVLYATPMYQLGYVSVQKIFQKVVQNANLPSQIPFEMNPERVSRDNLKTWANNLAAWGYQGVPKDYLFLKLRKRYPESN